MFNMGTMNHSFSLILLSILARLTAALVVNPEWQYSRHSYKFSNSFFMGMVGVEAKEGAVGFTTNTDINPVNLDKRIKLKEWFVVPMLGTLVLSRG